MIRSRKIVRFAVMIVLCSACVDSTGPAGAVLEAGDPLAQTFDELARQSQEDGDVTRGDAFVHAALAVRAGIAPSRLDVRNGAALEVYEAIVSAAAWDGTIAAASRPPERRSLVAWRQARSGPTQVLTLTAPNDSAPVLHPASAGPLAQPFASASALYQETTLSRPAAGSAIADVFFIGTAGVVVIRDIGGGGVCPALSSQIANAKRVGCGASRYAVRFDVAMQQLASRPAVIPVTPAARRIGTVSEQAVNGFKFNFACVVVSSVRGCA